MDKVRTELLDRKTTCTNQKMNIELLRMIATTRICLEASAGILSTEGQRFLTDIQHDIQLKKNLEKVKANLALFIKDVGNADMHLFFHRFVIHKYGKQELLEIIKKYPWMEFQKQDIDEKVSILRITSKVLSN